MIQTIRLDRILQGAVATPYRDLVTRPTGAAVRHGVVDALHNQPCVTAVLDFSAVGLLDFSCADEVVAKLVMVMQTSPGPFLVLAGLSEDHSEAIDHVLSRHSLVVAALPHPGETPFLLGPTSNEARLAFRFVHEHGPCTLSGLVGGLGWSFDQASQALQELIYHRLVLQDDATYRPFPLQ